MFFVIENLGINFSKTRGAVVNQAMETELPGVFSAGNVLHVHDVVDYVVVEAREAAEGAVLYLNGKLNNDPNYINCVGSTGVNYVVPQKVCVSEANDVITFKFRVNKPYKDINIVFRHNGEVVKKVYKTAIIPSEMEMVKFPKSLFKSNVGELTITVEEK